MCCLTRSHPHAHNVWLSGGRLWSLDAPLDRFTIRESGKGGVVCGKERIFFASPRYSLCVLFSVKRQTHARSNSLKQQKQKREFQQLFFSTIKNVLSVLLHLVVMPQPHCGLLVST